jgi:hypothetical protein
MILSFIIRNTETGHYLVELGEGGTMTSPKLDEAKLFYTSTIADVVVKRMGNNWAREEYWLMTMPAPRRMKDWQDELKEQAQTHFDIEKGKQQRHPELYGNYGC